jgi:hypothetical protein
MHPHLHPHLRPRPLRRRTDGRGGRKVPAFMIETVLLVAQRAAYVAAALLLALLARRAPRLVVHPREHGAEPEVRPLALALGMIGGLGLVGCALRLEDQLGNDAFRVVMHAASPVICTWGVLGSTRRHGQDVVAASALVGILFSIGFALRAWYVSPERLALVLGSLWFVGFGVSARAIAQRHPGPLKVHEPLAAVVAASMAPAALGVFAWGVNPTGYLIAQVMGLGFSVAIATLAGCALWTQRSRSS